MANLQVGFSRNFYVELVRPSTFLFKIPSPSDMRTGHAIRMN